VKVEDTKTVRDLNPSPLLISFTSHVEIAKEIHIQREKYELNRLALVPKKFSKALYTLLQMFKSFK
jgi:hypothetical protein